MNELPFWFLIGVVVLLALQSGLLVGLLVVCVECLRAIVYSLGNIQGLLVRKGSDE